MDNVISLKVKRHEKELKYEKRMLKELSLNEIKHKISHNFDEIIKPNSIEDGCVDFAIEAFLLGARYSRFGYYGESMQIANGRCQYEEKQLVNDLYEYVIEWGKFKHNNLDSAEVFNKCRYYISSWWKEGFLRGEKRHKLRL
ncbi:DUF2521 family protein [Metabacillus fastidiosus]|uniref:DUF2521 family protein n=1 Tax=Metabacillus fastidiosus TaxID=1458 RepID=A0ABU6NZU1_9BACI|nr:DUF2521 family protein [Metabacillus fastidiosus]MED4402198.1 DUF2521 family protein [Metabacillus fastidiosus]MED4456321.1 DUF2521 family protein [Metabacillus fastidiosus]MED4464827.1 DUF2521 family protein [Metabacillus fastidiosus]